MIWILTACVIINLITFSMMGIDKYKSQHDKWRIKESTLIIGAFLMGGIGSLIGSNVFRHKTRKLKFKLLLPISVVCNAVALYLLYLSTIPLNNM